MFEQDPLTGMYHGLSRDHFKAAFRLAHGSANKVYNDLLVEMRGQCGSHEKAELDLAEAAYAHAFEARFRLIMDQNKWNDNTLVRIIGGELSTQYNDGLITLHEYATAVFNEINKQPVEKE